MVIDFDMGASKKEVIKRVGGRVGAILKQMMMLQFNLKGVNSNGTKANFQSPNWKRFSTKGHLLFASG